MAENLGPDEKLEWRRREWFFSERSDVGVLGVPGLRVVVDARVLVSAFRAEGKPRQLLGHLLSTGQLVSSSEIMGDVTELIWREFIWEKKDPGPYTRISSFLRTLQNGAKIAYPKTLGKLRSGEYYQGEYYQDDIVLRAARNGDASYVVSEDRRLFNLGRLEGVRVATVEEILRVLGLSC